MPMLSSPLALLALGALVPLALLYIFRKKSTPKPVSSLLLWEGLFEREQGGRQRERFILPLLLILEAVAVALLALAAAGLLLPGQRASQIHVFILDDSYSMQAPAGRSTARDLAEQHIKNTINTTTAEVAFILAGPRPSLLTIQGDDPSTNPSTNAAYAFKNWSAAQPSADIQAALTLAREIFTSAAHITVLTDTPADKLSIELTANPGTHWLALGQSQENAAIVNARRGQRETVIELVHFSNQPATALLACAFGDQPASQQRVELLPDKRAVVRIDTTAAGSQDVICTLSAPGIRSDDRVVLPPIPGRRVRVGIDIADQTLRNAIREAAAASGLAANMVDLVPADLNWPATSASTGAVDLLFTDRPQDATTTQFNPQQASMWTVRFVPQPKDAGVYMGPYIIDRAHPITDGLELTGVLWPVAIQKSTDTPATTPTTSPVVMLDQTTLIAASTISGSLQAPQVLIHIDHQRTNLFRTSAWPALIWNTLSWRASAIPGVQASAVAQGELVQVTPGPDGNILHTPPSGSAEQLTSSRPISVALNQPGIHAFRVNNTTHRVAANTLGGAEGDLLHLGPQDEHTQPIENQATADVNRNLTWAVALALLCILGLHAWLISPKGKDMQ